MATKIVIASGKGGVGKSTTAALLGRSLAAMQKNTLLVDCDAGLSTLDLLLNPPADGIYNWMDVYGGLCEMKEALVNVEPCLTLLPAPGQRPEGDTVDCLRKILAPIEDEYDYILLDGPAGLGMGLERAARAADSALVVATADEVSVRGAGKADQMLRDCGITQTRLLINRYDVKAARKGLMLDIDSAIDKTYVQLIGVVPEEQAVLTYSVTHTLGKKSAARAAYARIAQRLEGEHVRLSLALLKKE